MKVSLDREDLMRFLEDAESEKMALLYNGEEIIYDFIDDWILLQVNKQLMNEIMAKVQIKEEVENE
jgi:hypothetical protein